MKIQNDREPGIDSYDLIENSIGDKAFRPHKVFENFQSFENFKVRSF